MMQKENHLMRLIREHPEIGVAIDAAIKRACKGNFTKRQPPEDDIVRELLRDPRFKRVGDDWTFDPTIPPPTGLDGFA
jgi:hypothetical protein